jgi:uncharacterized protein (DUF2164 family)
MKLFLNYAASNTEVNLKKLISISLILVFLFQFIGYYFMNMGLRYQAKTEIAKRLEAERYSESETITFKVPLAVPYGVDSKDYERINGEFEHNGEFYKLVKQKLLHDTLYIVCINNKAEKQLVADMANFIKLSTDLPSSSKENSTVVNNLLKEFVSQSSLELVTLAGWSLDRTFFSPSSDRLVETDFSILSPPPKFSC